MTLRNAATACLYAVAAVAATVAYQRGLPGLRELPGWFYMPRSDVRLGPVVFAFVLAAAPWVCRFAWRAIRAGRIAQGLSAMMVVGIAMQPSLTLLTPAGIEQSYTRLEVGHGEFIRVAAQQRDQLWSTLRDYDALYEQHKLGDFAGTKPPGTLAFYILVDKVARAAPVRSWLSPLRKEIAKTHHLGNVRESAALILVLFPLLTFLTMRPLFEVARDLFGDTRAAYAAALLYLTAPAILLIDLHLDGALFPLITMSSLALAVKATQQRSLAPAAASGVIAMLGIYCSYGLLPSFALTLLAAGALGLQQALRTRQLKPLLPLATVCVGALLTLGLLIVVLKFQPLHRFHVAMDVHAAWKGAVPHALWRKLSLVEFGLYAGPPLMLAFTIALLESAADLGKRRRYTLSLSCIAVAALLIALAVSQGTDEVARLWLFMVPPIAVCAGASQVLRSADVGLPAGVIVLAVAQAGLSVLMKCLQSW